MFFCRLPQDEHSDLSKEGAEIVVLKNFDIVMLLLSQIGSAILIIVGANLPLKEKYISDSILTCF